MDQLLGRVMREALPDRSLDERLGQQEHVGGSCAGNRCDCVEEVF